MEQKHDVSASADGKKNAYTFGCDVVGHQIHYAVCLGLIRKAQGDGVPAAYEACGRAIRRKECPALAMREKEIAAGKAIYFTERYQGGFLSGQIGALVGKAKDFFKPVKPAEKPASEMPTVDAGGYAAAINEAMKKTETKPVKAVATSGPTAQVGESPLQIARRLMGKN